MAKQNLQSLLAKINKDTEAEKKGSLRSELNRHIHIYSLRLTDLIKEVRNQLEGNQASKSESRVSLTKQQDILIKKLCLEYFKSLKEAMLNGQNSYYKVRILASSPQYFEIEITSKRGGDVFKSFISKHRKGPLDKLRQDLFAGLNTEDPTTYRRIFGSDPSLGGGLLQIGHQKGYSVAESRAAKYLRSLDIKTNNIQNKFGDIQALIDLTAEVSTSTRLAHLKNTKVRIVYVSEQGQDSNRTQGGEERAIISSIKKKLEKALSAEEWANFKTSPSATDIIVDSLFSKAKKSGAKVSTKVGKIQDSKTKAKDTKKIKVGTKTKARDSLNLSSKVEVEKSNSVQNWLSLLPIINARLLPKVLANMKAPALVNRTGTFAQSVEVTNIEQTREGYPSFVFDYERDPYDVFDRVKGRAPWNTTQRDPRALVDKSVREVVREMAINRFYTRRA